MSTAAWADEVVPTPVYFNDFSFATSGSDGIEIVGNGKFEDDSDPRFGRIFHNDPTNTSAIRTNYLKLPADVLSHSGASNAMTIGFWVNKKAEDSYFFTPLFAAYGDAPSTTNSWPMLVCETRGLIQINCSGYCDFGINDGTPGTSYNDGTPYVNTVWLDDAEWHYYTVVFTTTTAKVYIDGVLKNGWTVNGTSDGQVISGLLEHGNDLDYVTLGGNQAWDWADPDPAFGFDDFAVYDVALSKAQIDQIRANKLNRTVTGTKIGNIDGSTEYLAASSTQKTLYPGDSYHYSFINYNNGSTNWNNWVLPVYNTSDTRVITVRADNYEDIVGANTGCTSNFNFTNFPGNINGATYDMTVTFTADKKFNMSSTINTVDGSEWSYSYTSGYTGSPIDLTGNDYIKVALSVSRSWLDVQSEGYSAIGAAIGATKWRTFASDYILNFDGISGLTANVVSDYNTSTKSITVTPVTEVPAATPLLLNGNEGVYSVPVLASTSASIGTNYLVRGPGDEVGKATGTNTRFVLVVSGGNAVFKKIGDTKPEISKDKAYLEIPAVLSARELSINLDGGDATAIKTMKVGTEDNIYYNLQGQRVLYPTKGLYIVNGKKVIVK